MPKMIDYLKMARTAITPFLTEAMDAEGIIKEWAEWLKDSGVEVQGHANALVAATIEERIKNLAKLRYQTYAY